MARTIPLIRAAVLFPMIRWLKENGHSEQEWLDWAGLDPLSEGLRERPVPLLKVFDLFRRLSTEEGPDACARLVSPHSIEDLGVLGMLVMGAATPREALTRTVNFLPRYSTHENMTLRPIADGLRLQAGWSMHMDHEIAHLTQQFTAALVFSLCLATGQPSAAPRHMKIRPHPRCGNDHLLRIFGDDLAPSDGTLLSLEIDDRVLDAPFALNGTMGIHVPPQGWTMPQGEGSFSASVRLTLEALHAEREPRLDQVAEVAGVSPRSLQRMLTNEGSNFRTLVDEFRRSSTLRALQAEDHAVRPDPQDLGFSGQSALARAVRRWTGVSPKRFRRLEALSDGTSHDAKA